VTGNKGLALNASPRVCRHVTSQLICLCLAIVSDEKRYIAQSFFSSLINRTADSFLIMHRIAAFIYHVSNAVFTICPRYKQNVIIWLFFKSVCLKVSKVVGPIPISLWKQTRPLCLSWLLRKENEG